MGRDRRLRARFPITVWNQHDRVLQIIPRTNNAIESWHHAFNHTVSVAHHTLQKLVIKLRAEAHAVEMCLCQERAGIAQSQQRKVYARAADSIRTLVSDFSQSDRMDYIHNGASVLHLGR